MPYFHRIDSVRDSRERLYLRGLFDCSCVTTTSFSALAEGLSKDVIRAEPQSSVDRQGIQNGEFSHHDDHVTDLAGSDGA